MAKERVSIPAKTREQVLKEYSHLCAICGGVGPQLHHVDEDPSNNDLMNLIPLCANHHLTDQHNPTKRIETGILRLFRQYKDPAILTPQFHVLFRRMRFLDEIDLDYSDFGWLKQAERLHAQAWTLIQFAKSLEMGDFYSGQLAKLVSFTGKASSGEQVAFTVHERLASEEYCEKLSKARDEVYDLLVEQLRFQDWKVSE